MLPTGLEICFCSKKSSWSAIMPSPVSYLSIIPDSDDGGATELGYASETNDIRPFGSDASQHLVSCVPLVARVDIGGWWRSAL